MADSRRDPQHGDLLTHRNQMIAVTERQGDLVSYLLRYANGAEISGVLSLDDWFRAVCDATPAGKVKITKHTFEV